MKKQKKNDSDILGYVAKIQEQLEMLDRKLNLLIEKSMPPKPTTPAFAPKPFSQPNSFNQQPPRQDNRFNNNQRQDNRQRERIMYKTVCADCRKQCEVPFRPSGDRPVYCQECFSRRKNANNNSFKPGIDNRPRQTLPPSPVNIVKPAAEKKDLPGKKKPTVKKKKGK